MNTSGVLNTDSSGSSTLFTKLTTAELLQLSNLAAMQKDLVIIQTYLETQREEILLRAGTRVDIRG